ncbi:MAG: transcriptional repressor [Alphaproteobacteria bacterium]|nr:transcriptional repressor [Alphaproteobacteria bacterium]
MKKKSLHHPHNHTSCIANAILAAEKISLKKKVQLTPLRRDILKIIWGSHKPIKAYTILSILSKKKGVVAPLTIYRGLDFLLELGLIHRLESLNAFIGCPHPLSIHRSQFFICTTCQDVMEMTTVSPINLIKKEAEVINFTITEPIIEIKGCCQKCRI